ncbi:hypothetical protein GJAV_G00272780 [Gymnothorax javanicus]|nr:hypothetical protein GJAV_G00272780 [Gymnothorax javanicus]
MQVPEGSRCGNQRMASGPWFCGLSNCSTGTMGKIGVEHLVARHSFKTLHRYPSRWSQRMRRIAVGALIGLTHIQDERNLGRLPAANILIRLEAGLVGKTGNLYPVHICTRMTTSPASQPLLVSVDQVVWMHPFLWSGRVTGWPQLYHPFTNHGHRGGTRGGCSTASGWRGWCDCSLAWTYRVL